jgi:hypothetical protein
MYRYDLTRGLILRADGQPLPGAPALNLDGPDQSIRATTLTALNDPYDHTRVMPGGMSLSANGSIAGSGIVWATHVLRDNGEYKNVFGILRAYDAVTLQEIWNSGTYQFDPNFLGKHAKYAPATIARGRAFVPTNSNRLVVYGLAARARAFTPPWQEWIDLGEARRRGDEIIPSSAVVTPISRAPGVLDTYLADKNGTILNGGFLVGSGQYFWGYPIPKASEQPDAAPVASIVDANGIRFAYGRFGKPSGLPLVFNQHYHRTSILDPAVTDGLAKNREVILLNNAGVSSSSGEVPTSFEEMGANAIAFIKALGLTAYQRRAAPVPPASPLGPRSDR